MGMNKSVLPADLPAMRLCHYIFDDFDHFVDTDIWTDTSADSGASVANGDGVNGLMTLTTGATDNNEACLTPTRKDFKILANKGIVVEVRTQYSEGATNAANVAAGIMSAFTTDVLTDNGGGPASNFSGALIFKVDGGTVWKAVSSIGTDQLISTSTTTAGGSADQVLRIEIEPTPDGYVEFTFFVDGKPLYDAAQTVRNVPIKHRLAIGSPAAMGPGAYVKAGSGTSEVLKVDYVFAAQTR